MLLFFLPPVIQVVIGVVILVIGLALLHSVILAAAGLVGVAVGGVRYVRSRRSNGLPR
jgi:xanthine/uracil permease